MRVLLDTHVLIWAAAEPDRLGETQQLLIAAERRMVSAASVWELAIKQGLGKLDLGRDVATWLAVAVDEMQLDLLSVTADHAAAVEHLPPLHRDPFDRLLVVQAAAERAVLLTADPQLPAYGDLVRLVG